MSHIKARVLTCPILVWTLRSTWVAYSSRLDEWIFLSGDSVTWDPHPHRAADGLRATANTLHHEDDRRQRILTLACCSTPVHPPASGLYSGLGQLSSLSATLSELREPSGKGGGSLEPEQSRYNNECSDS